MIYREGGRRYIPIKFSVRGRDLAGAVRDAQAQIAASIEMPPGYRMEAALTRWIEHGLATAKTLRSRAAKRPPSTRRRPV